MLRTEETPAGIQTFKTKMAQKLVPIARSSGFFSVYGLLRSRLVKKQAAIIMYHRIHPDGECAWSPVSTITPREFEREIRYLSKNFQVISLDELSGALHEPERLPPKTAVITIDDGYKDVYTSAYPVLKKYGLPATVFLPTAYIGTAEVFWWDKVGYAIWHTELDKLELDELGTHSLGKPVDRLRAIKAITAGLIELPLENGYESIARLLKLANVDIPPDLGLKLTLSWDEVKEMSRNGISFGAHTVGHHILTRLPPDAAKQEIHESKQRIEQVLGQEITTFCYPNGGPADFNNDIKTILKQSGFHCAVIAGPPSFVSFGPTCDPYQLPRIAGESNFNMFQLIVSGVYSDLLARQRSAARSTRR